MTAAIENWSSFGWGFIGGLGFAAFWAGVLLWVDQRDGR